MLTRQNQGISMRRMRTLPFAACAALCACGGGGGGVNSTPTPIGSTPTPTPTPTPAATNTTLNDLRASQTFTNDAAALNLTLDRTTSTTINSSAAPGGLTVSYDANTASYSLAMSNYSQTFAPADIKSSDADQAQYSKTDGTTRDYLTLVKTPYSSNNVTQYVRLGYWQRNTSTDTQQNTLFGTFTYGLDTAAAAVPRSGTASFAIDVFGLSTFPGHEARSFQGSGNFSTDFAVGVFSARASLDERELVSGAGTTGGGIEFTGAGHLSSNGSFGGNMLYGSTNGALGGTMSGRFYGPIAQELGASFTGSKDGATVAGSFTGRLDSSTQPANLTLTNLTQPQLFYTQFGNGLVGQLNYQNSETFTYATATSDLYGGQFTINDKVASANPNFTTYRKTFSSTYDSQDVTLELYKPGAGNAELALTYASFGHWATTVPYGTGRRPVNQYFAYGLETPARLLSGKTGTGHYEGVVYGSGSNSQSGAAYAVTGTSQFDVNFTSQSLSGALRMTGSSTNGGTGIDFGKFDFAGKLAAYTANSAFTLTQAGQSVGQMETRFFGPDGEEIAGPFSANMPQGSAGAGTSISGVAAAKRQ